MSNPHHSFRNESLATGAIGAGVVALWFLVLDLINGQALVTPSILGQAIIFGRGAAVTNVVDYTAVAAYTVLHLAVFLVIGALVTKLVFLADRQGIFRFALLMLFVVFEVMFYGVVVMFLQGTRGLFPFWSILVANTLAAVSMGAYLYVRHPALRRGYLREPLGA